MTVTVLEGDARVLLPTLPDGVARCCVTSPPYFGLRDYGVEGQVGLEGTPEAYVADLVRIFRRVRRVLADDGTLWLNLGDSYAGSWGAQGRTGGMAGRTVVAARHVRVAPPRASGTGSADRFGGVPAKGLLGIPWRVALALQSDGWVLRSDIVWHKPNPMPESVTDRPTKAHEYVFLFSKGPRYFYDAGAIVEPATGKPPGNSKAVRAVAGGRRGNNANLRGSLHKIGARDVRNARSVWTLPTQPFSGAHFATMPPALAERCILAGSAPGDTVLDPFGGAGTTGLVANRLGRAAVLLELNPAYAALARDRIASEAPLLAQVASAHP